MAKPTITERPRAYWKDQVVTVLNGRIGSRTNVTIRDSYGFRKEVPGKELTDISREEPNAVLRVKEDWQERTRENFLNECQCQGDHRLPTPNVCSGLGRGEHLFGSQQSWQAVVEAQAGGRHHGMQRPSGIGRPFVFEHAATAALRAAVLVSLPTDV
jgi:hypothetical protein